MNVSQLPNNSNALGPEVDSVSNRNEYQTQKNNVSGEQPELKADNLTVICEPTV
jgi:hypothetical protein